MKKTLNKNNMLAILVASSVGLFWSCSGGGGGTAGSTSQISDSSPSGSSNPTPDSPAQSGGNVSSGTGIYVAYSAMNSGALDDMTVNSECSFVLDPSKTVVGTKSNKADSPKFIDLTTMQEVDDLKVGVGVQSCARLGDTITLTNLSGVSINYISIPPNLFANAPSFSVSEKLAILNQYKSEQTPQQQVSNNYSSPIPTD